jgi:peptide/nickel transport system permease protein
MEQQDLDKSPWPRRERIIHVRARTSGQRLLLLCLKDYRLFGASLLISVALILAICGPWLGLSPFNQSLPARLSPPGSIIEDNRHWLGTDSLGRDLFSRIIYGTRISLLVGLLGASVGAMIGIPLGLISGFYGKRIDAIVRSIADIQLGFPQFLLALALMAAVGPGIINLVVVLGVARWPIYCRIIRGEVQSFKERSCVEAARALGASDPYILLRYVFPNVVSPVLVAMTFGIADAILAEAGLSFLGFGVPPGIPSWGSIAAHGTSYMERAWWIVVFPGLAVAVFVVAINTFGDALRDRLDPKQAGRLK